MTNKLKLSAPDWCFYKKEFDPPTYYRRVQESGYSAVEMVEPSRWAAAREAGLTILNLAGPGMTEGLNYRENHAALVPEISKAIETAQANKIPHVIIFSGNRKGQPDDEGIKNCEAGIKKMLPLAEKRASPSFSKCSTAPTTPITRRIKAATGLTWLKGYHRRISRYCMIFTTCIKWGRMSCG
jgi:hypothetical protein